MTRPYPVVCMSNYRMPEDNPRASAVRAALRLVDQGCDDCDLLGALDDLEVTLTRQQMARLADEDAVADAVQKINDAFDNGDE